MLSSEEEELEQLRRLIDPLSDEAISERLEQLSRITDERLRNELPADRDRRLQRFLAQAMSPQRRLELLNQMTDFAIRVQRAQQGPAR